MSIVLSSLKIMIDKEEEYDKKIRFSLLLNNLKKVTYYVFISFWYLQTTSSRRDHLESYALFSTQSDWVCTSDSYETSVDAYVV